MPGKKGRSGRKPVPTNLKLLRGNPGKRPVNQNEAKPKGKLPEPPRHLSAEARRGWRRTGRILREMGLISDLDKAAFAGYCVAWARWVEAEEALKNYGMVLKGEKGLVRSPYLAIAAQALEQMKSFLSDFGMTPASRSRIHATPVEEDDPFEMFLKARPGG